MKTLQVVLYIVAYLLVLVVFAGWVIVCMGLG